MEDAAHEVLPAKTKAQPSWFLADKENLTKFIDERNTAMSAYMRARKKTRLVAARLRSARKKVKSAVAEAKNSWIKGKEKQLNNGSLQKSSRNCW